MSNNLFASLGPNDSDDSSSSTDSSKKYKKNIKKNNIVKNNIKTTNTINKYSNNYGDFDDTPPVNKNKVKNKINKSEAISEILSENNIKKAHSEENNVKIISQEEKNNPFETHVSRKTFKKNVREIKIKSVLENFSFIKMKPDSLLEDLDMSSYYQVYAHYNGDKNWRYGNYLTVSKLSSWQNIGGFINSVNKDHGQFSMNNFDVFVMKNNISPMWEDEQNKHGSIMSIKLSSNDDAFSIFKFLLLNICNNSLLIYTDKTFNKTNGITFSTKVIENINIKSYIVKIWFKDNFCTHGSNPQNIFNPHINERLDGHSVKFRQIKAEF